MEALELILILFTAAVVLAALARRIGAPYPIFLALGGVLLAVVPGMPTFTLQPELALALFVAPVLLDAAYDASLRDLKDNWIPVLSLAIVSVGLTTAAVAVVAHLLVQPSHLKLRIARCDQIKFVPSLALPRLQSFP